jgi:hypothetical protein
MDSGKLSAQLETLPASGLTLDLKGVDFFNHENDQPPGLFYVLSFVYLLFFLLLLITLSVLPLQTWQVLFFSVIIIGYCQYLFRRHFLLNYPLSIKKLVFTELGWCHVQLNNSQVFKADIESDTILTEHLVLLNLRKHHVSEHDSFFGRIKSDGFSNHYSVILTADRLGSERFREIKRHLRFISFSQKEHE